MTREQLKSFLRALLATLLAGLVLWLFHKIGVNVTLPTLQNSQP